MRIKRIHKQFGIATLVLLVFSIICVAYLNRSAFYNSNTQVNQKNQENYFSSRSNINEFKKASDGQYDIVVGLDSWIGSTPFTYALKNGIDKKNSLKIGVEELFDDTTKIQALNEGKINITYITLPTYIKMQKDYGGKGVIVGISDYSYGAEAILAKSEIKDIKALKNKKVSTLYDDTSKFVLYKFLKLAGLNVNDITLNERNNLDEIIKDLKENTADATISYCPELYAVLNAVNSKKANAIRILATTKDVPDMIPTVLVCNKDFAARYPEKVIAFLKTHYDGVADLKSLKNEENKKIVEASKIFPNIYGNVMDSDVQDALSDIKLLSLEEASRYFDEKGRLEEVIKDTITIWSEFEKIPVESMKSDIYINEYIGNLLKIK